MNPSEVRHTIDQIKRDLAALDQEYRWLHGAAYGNRSYAGAGGKATGHADPTLSTLTDSEQAKFRSRLKEAAKLLEEARKKIEKAKERASERYRLVDLPKSHGLPRATSQNDLKALEEAASRRASRGEGYGES